MVPLGDDYTLRRYADTFPGPLDVEDLDTKYRQSNVATYSPESSVSPVIARPMATGGSLEASPSHVNMSSPPSQLSWHSGGMERENAVSEIYLMGFGGSGVSSPMLDAQGEDLHTGGWAQARAKKSAEPFKETPSGTSRHLKNRRVAPRPYAQKLCRHAQTPANETLVQTQRAVQLEYIPDPLPFWVS